MFTALAFASPIPVPPKQVRRNQSNTSRANPPPRTTPVLRAPTPAVNPSVPRLPHRPPPAPPAVRNATPIVVGAGPCGALAAAALHFRGVPCILVERESEHPPLNLVRTYPLILVQRARKFLPGFPHLADALASQMNPINMSRLVVVSNSGRRVTLPIDLSPSDGQPDKLGLRQGFVNALRKYIADHCSSVTTMYDTELTAIEVQHDGFQVHLRTKGSNSELKKLRSSLVLACDGKNSAAVQHLRNAAENGSIRSSSGFGDWQKNNLSSLMSRKTIVLNDLFCKQFYAQQFEKQPWGVIVQGAIKGEHAFRLDSVPPPPPYGLFTNGTPASVVLPSSHSLWKVRDVDKMFSLFEKNFPQLAVRDMISQESMRLFAQGRESPYGTVRRVESLVGKVGETGGIIILGDAAHSFPPDLGQGVNAVFEDVAVLAHVLDNSDEHASVKQILEAYEDQRAADVEALMRIELLGVSTSGGRSSALGRLGLVNKLVRLVLAKILRGWIYPNISEMVVEDISYSEIMRRADVTTLRLCIAAMSTGLISVLVYMLQ